jgi:hypothetical protein
MTHLENRLKSAVFQFTVEGTVESMVFFLHESLRLSARDAVSGMWGDPFQPTVSLDPTRYSRKTLGEYLKKTPSGVSDPDSLNPDPYKVSCSNPDSDQEFL